MDAVVASGSVLGMKQTAGKTFPSTKGTAATGSPEPALDAASASGSNGMIIGAAAGAAAGVMVVALGAWKASTKCRAQQEPLMEVVSAGMVAGPVDKVAIEELLFGEGDAGTGHGSSQKRLLERV
eukprot:211387-Rhodomonas_salina.1